MRTTFKATGRGGCRAFTLAEATIATAIAALTFSGIVTGYILSGRNAEWSSLSLAAQSLAMQRIEQTRACKWDPNAATPVDQLVNDNFPTQWTVLEVPISGTNYVYATNFTTITLVSSSPPLKMVRSDAVWRFPRGRLYTNSIFTYRAPDS